MAETPLNKVEDIRSKNFTLTSKVLSKAELWTLVILGLCLGNFWKSKPLMKKQQMKQVKVMLKQPLHSDASSTRFHT